jgi:hypothetical protein
MAEGNFRIVKYSPGDDEIDYSLYNADHTSGSAYYDLEILQSPVMEAATKQASSIKYGLLSITRTDILFMPTLKANQKISEALNKKGSVFILAANRETYENLSSDSVLGEKFVLEPNTKTPSRTVVIESGIDSSERQATLENRNAMLVASGLLDSNFEFKFDSRFVAGLTSVQGGKFANLSDGTRDISMSTFATRTAIGAQDFIENYSTAIAPGIANLVAKRDGSVSGNDLSGFEGPRGTVTAATFVPSTEINAEGSSTPSFYSLYGRTSVAAATLGFTGSNTYDVIDTTVYVRGLTSGTQIQIPLRIVRKKS